MRILLTGVAGFLGSHLAKKLLDNNFIVYGLDNFSTGVLANLDFQTHPNFTLIDQDVSIPCSLHTDAILNFACPASPKYYQIDPVKTIETNFLGVSNLLRLARDTGAIFLQASTSEVYGDPLVNPQKESYWGNVNPIGIRSCYDEGKRSAETLCFDYKRQYDVDSRVIRIFNTYGPKMSIDDGRVVSNFIVQALRNEPLTIYGDGSQTRSFCYVSDLIEGIFKVLTLGKKLEEPLNLGNPNQLSMLELAKKVIEVTKSNSELIYKPLPKDDPKIRQPDITKAKEILKWYPEINIDNGVRLTTEYFIKQLKNA